MPHNLTGNH